MISFTRIMTVVMFGAICFMLIVPTALKGHNTPLAIGIVVLFVAYLVTNLILWQRMKRRS
ncbi:MAG: hypothetical protein KGN02_08720 [bacterium]|nr:hypothetical protein [bacterium]